MNFTRKNRLTTHEVSGSTLPLPHIVTLCSSSPPFSARCTLWTLPMIICTRNKKFHRLTVGETNFVWHAYTSSITYTLLMHYSNNIYITLDITLYNVIHYRRPKGLSKPPCLVMLHMAIIMKCRNRSMTDLLYYSLPVNLIDIL